MKKLISLLLVMVMVLGLVGCGNAESKEPKEPKATGASFTVVVADLEGKETTFEYTSDKATVGEALIAEGLIEGHETEYGLYVDSVNGVTLDWDKDGKYWAFYIDGEYAMTGVDTTEITEGATYDFMPE